MDRRGEVDRRGHARTVELDEVRRRCVGRPGAQQPAQGCGEIVPGGHAVDRLTDEQGWLVDQRLDGVGHAAVVGQQPEGDQQVAQVGRRFLRRRRRSRHDASSGQRQQEASLGGDRFAVGRELPPLSRDTERRAVEQGDAPGRWGRGTGAIGQREVDDEGPQRVQARS